MTRKTITAHVKMDEKTLRRFAFFNDILLRGRFIRPLVFAAIMLTFGIICFSARREGSVLLGTVLTVIGLGLPLVYFGTFFAQVKGQAKKLRLSPPRAVYTLAFGANGVHIKNDMRQEEEVDLPWDKAFAAYRRRQEIYFYAAPTRAFILPDGQADASPDELWAMLEARMPEGRTYLGMRRIKQR